MKRKHVALISTGGTIEKTYDEFAGVLNNHTNVLDVVLATLQLDGTELVRVPLLNKDSLDMTESDHDLIAQTVASMTSAHDGVIVVHGTDKLSISGERIYDLVTNPRVPIVLTGAMRPYVMRNTDAVQNLTEALLAAKVPATQLRTRVATPVLELAQKRREQRARFRLPSSRIR